MDGNAAVTIEPSTNESDVAIAEAEAIAAVAISEASADAAVEIAETNAEVTTTIIEGEQDQWRAAHEDRLTTLETALSQISIQLSELKTLATSTAIATAEMEIATEEAPNPTPPNPPEPAEDPEATQGSGEAPEPASRAGGRRRVRFV